MQVTPTVALLPPDAPSATGTARLLDNDGTAQARKLLARRYVMSRAGNWFGVLRRQLPPPNRGRGRFGLPSER